jgi:hypothetical protein
VPVFEIDGHYLKRWDGHNGTAARHIVGDSPGACVLWPEGDLSVSGLRYWLFPGAQVTRRLTGSPLSAFSKTVTYCPRPQTMFQGSPIVSPRLFQGQLYVAKEVITHSSQRALRPPDV